MSGVVYQQTDLSLPSSVTSGKVSSASGGPYISKAAANRPRIYRYYELDQRKELVVT